MGSGTGDLGMEDKSGNWHAFETLAQYRGATWTEKLVFNFGTSTHTKGVLEKGKELK